MCEVQFKHIFFFSFCWFTERTDESFFFLIIPVLVNKKLVVSSLKNHLKSCQVCMVLVLMLELP